jgi:hypothetical protein
VENPQTVASAIRIGNPASWRLAEAARDESGGEINAVSDDEILDAYRLLAQEEGIFCEPASAACVAGLLKYARDHDLGRQTVVCIITGHGLKDPETALAISSEMRAVEPASRRSKRRWGSGRRRSLSASFRAARFPSPDGIWIHHLATIHTRQQLARICIPRQNWLHQPVRTLTGKVCRELSVLADEALGSSQTRFSGSSMQ